MQAGSLKKIGKGIMLVHDEIKKQVEEEYLDSFWNVVRGFAADNYGCNTTARIIGYKYPSTFRALMKRECVEINWPKPGTCNGFKEKGETTKKGRDAAIEAIVNNPDSVAGLYFKSTGETVEQLARRLCATNTAVEISRIVGWKRSRDLKDWLRVRGIDLEYCKYQPIAPQGKGWQEDEFREIDRVRIAKALARKTAN